ncbi:MAG: hypothetical protein K6E30_09910 [Lachnospiraceae bacterium]|nr:hypothetical protein [Lachnospiraceae bacterium]
MRRKLLGLAAAGLAAALMLGGCLPESLIPGEGDPVPPGIFLDSSSGAEKLPPEESAPPVVTESAGTTETGNGPEAESGSSGGGEAWQGGALEAWEDSFRYGFLTDHQKKVYRDLYEKASSRLDVFKVTALDSDSVESAYYALLADHPELFWLSGAASIYGSEGPGEKEVTLVFNMEADRIGELSGVIEERVREYLSSLPEGASEYQRVKAAYEYIIKNTDYEPGAAQGQNIQSALISRASVCAGYSRAFQYLLHRAGVFCAYLSGTVERDGRNEPHAWNLVRIDGTYTYVDVTWGDPNYGGMPPGEGMPEITYDYLCLTSDEMERTSHRADEELQMPDCSSKAYDYYFLNGCCFESFDEESVSSRLWAAVDNNIREVHFKYASYEEYAKAASAIFEGGLLKEVLQQRMQWDGSRQISYYPMLTDGLYSIDIYW